MGTGVKRRDKSKRTNAEFAEDAENAEKREMVSVIWVGLKCCHGPSTTRPGAPLRLRSGQAEDAERRGNGEVALRRIRSR